MSVDLQLEAQDIDLIFLALQSAVLPVNYLRVKSLMDKITEQGLPQLHALAVKEGSSETS